MLCCGGEICVSMYRPSLKTSPRAPSPGVDLPFPCLYQCVCSSGAACGAPWLWFLLLFVFRRQAQLQQLRGGKKSPLMSGSACSWLFCRDTCACARVGQSFLVA